MSAEDVRFLSALAESIRLIIRYEQIKEEVIS